MVFKFILTIDGWDICNEISSRWRSLDLTDDKSTLVQVMAWCRQATSHYLSQCWPRSLSPYGVTRPQCVKCVFFLPAVMSPPYDPELLVTASTMSDSVVRYPECHAGISLLYVFPAHVRAAQRGLLSSALLALSLRTLHREISSQYWNGLSRFRWLSAKQQCLHCISNGDTAVLHLATDFIMSCWWLSLKLW